MGKLAYFHTPNTYTNDQNFKYDLKRLNKLACKNYEGMSVSELDSVIYILERMALSTRRLLEETVQYDRNNSAYYKTKTINELASNSEFLYGNLPVCLNFFDYKGVKYLHIFTPFLFRRGMKESFLMSNYVRIEIEKNKKEVNDFFMKGKPKFIVHVVRSCDKFSPRRHKDNDNLEVTEIINRTLGYGGCISDNPLMMNFMSELVEGRSEEELGMHFFISEQKGACLDGEELLNHLKNNYLCRR